MNLEQALARITQLEAQLQIARGFSACTHVRLDVVGVVRSDGPDDEDEYSVKLPNGEVYYWPAQYTVSAEAK